MALYKTLVNKISILPNKKTKQKDYTGSKYPIIDQGKSLIGGYTDNEEILLNCDLPVIVFGDHTKAVKYIDFIFGAGADGIKVLSPKENVLPKYLYYGTIYLTFKIEDKGYARHYQFLEKSELPVPALEEQTRIVTKIEELFSQLDSGVETLKKTKQQLAVYRQAVLKEAFCQVDKSEYILFSKIIIGTPQNGIYKPKSDYGKGTRILRIDGFYDGFLLEDYDYKLVSLSDEEITHYRLEIGNIVINRVNSMPYLGKCALIRNLKETTVFESNMMRIAINKSLANGEYITYYLSSLAGKKELTKNAKQAVNQASINQKDVGSTIIPLPNLNTQNRIVEEIESRLSVCDSIEKTVDEALQQAEALRQSILKKAFEGEMI